MNDVGSTPHKLRLGWVVRERILGKYRGRTKIQPVSDPRGEGGLRVQIRDSLEGEGR